MRAIMDFRVLRVADLQMAKTQNHP